MQHDLWHAAGQKHTNSRMIHRAIRQDRHKSGYAAIHIAPLFNGRALHSRYESNGRNMQEQVARLERAHFDGEPAAEPENQDGKNSPPIEEDEIELESADKTKAAVTFAARRSEGDCGEDKSDDGPGREVKNSSTRFRGASGGQVIR